MFTPYYQTPNRSPVGDTSASCHAYSITLGTLLGSASRCLWSLNYHVLTAARWACVARCVNRLQKAVSP